MRKQDDASGISAPRLSALSVVVFGGPLTLGQLAGAEQVQPPTMTRIVTGLENDGLVQRKSDPRDGRVTRIHATAKGQRVLAAARARRVEQLASSLKRLGAKDLAELARGIQLFRQVIASMRSENSAESKNESP